MNSKWEKIKFWLKIVATVIVIAIIIRIGFKSIGTIQKVMRFFGFKDDAINSQIKIEHFEKVNTGDNKNQETEKFVDFMKKKYLEAAQ